jgi:hypothetical protein
VNAPAVFAALYAAHQVGDHWVQADVQAAGKGRPGWPGRLACARHTATLAAAKATTLGALAAATGLRLSLAGTAAGLAADAASHYWADRRTTLAALIPGEAAFFRLGAPRPGHDDAPHLGTGAYALDKSWHIACLFAASLIIAALSG